MAGTNEKCLHLSASSVELSLIMTSADLRSGTDAVENIFANSRDNSTSVLSVRHMISEDRAGRFQ